MNRRRLRDELDTRPALDAARHGLLSKARIAGALLLLAAVPSACVPPAPPATAPGPLDPPALQAAWAATLTNVQDELERGRYGAADSALNSFVQTYRGTPQSAEAYFWLAVVNLDPANQGGSPRAALVAADAYIAGGRALPNFELAQVLRRAAGALESAMPPEPLPEPTVIVAPDSAARARANEEISRLKSELEKAQAELDRIKKRIRP